MNRPGYKETNVGWIPEDWEVKCLKEIAAINELSLSENTLPDLSFYYLSLSDVNGDRFSIPDGKITFVNSPSRARRKFKQGDVLLSTVRPNLKGFGFVDFESDEFICSTGFAVIHAKPDAYGKFIYHTLYSHVTSKYFYACVVGSNYPALNNNDVEKLKIPTPSLLEQHKIAEILSAWDTAIELVGKQIEAKQRLKKGLMQHLLTGKIRFPGFNNDWKDATLKQLSKLLVSNVDKKSSDDETLVDLCNYLDVYKNEYITRAVDFMPATATKKEIKKFSLKVGDVILTKDSETREDIASTAVVTETVNNLVCGYHLAILRLDPKKGNSVFLAKLLSHGRTHHHFVAYANGATRFGLTISAIENAKVRIPSVDEQKRIAQVFLSIDRELDKLQKKIDVFRQQKQGLMQKLLTGEVRIQIIPPIQRR